MVDMPDLPPHYAQVMVVQADAPKQGAAKTDHTIGVCHLIQNPPTPPDTAVNVISPLVSASLYLQERERKTLDWKFWKVSVLQGPEHGVLEMGARGGYYRATGNYIGSDHATLLVEIGDLKVNVIYFFKVSKGGIGGTEGYDPYEDKKNCPKGKTWKVSLNPNDPNGGLISFQHLITHKLPNEP